MNVRFTRQGWADYQYWVEQDRAILGRVNALITDTSRNPFTGVGKPEPLAGRLSGWWSRRINGEHRLVYRISGKAGVDQSIEVASCRFHYRS